MPVGEQTASNTEDKLPKPEPEIDLLKSLSPFIKYVRWENKDADYFLKNVHGHNMMTEENENAAMASMLQSFIDNQPLVSIWTIFFLNYYIHIMYHLGYSNYQHAFISLRQEYLQKEVDSQVRAEEEEEALIMA